MSTVSIRERRPQLIRPIHSEAFQEEEPQPWVRSSPGVFIFFATIKASMFGAVGAFFLLLTSFIPTQYVTFLVMPGFVVVFMAAGMLASIFVDEVVPLKTYKRAGEIGWIAGFWTGVQTGIVVMLLAAIGLVMGEFGQKVILQLTPEQLRWAATYGWSESLIALTARVFGALLVYGLIGSLVAAILGTIGGMLYMAVSHPAED